MPIFVNWFEVEISAPVQHLFSRDFVSWDDSQTAHDKLAIPGERFCRMPIREADKEIARTVLFGAIDPIPDGFIDRAVDLTKERRVAERVIEFSLGQHLASRGMHVEYGSWGVSATQSAFRVADIGLTVESGISFKSFYLHYKRQHGITLNWRVRQFFDQTLNEMPASIKELLLGMPVLLRAGENKLQPEILEYDGGYLGTILDIQNGFAEVLCRDSKKRQVATNTLILEARPEVVAAISSVSKEQRGTDSIQRKILTISHSLTQSGRRNVRILQDKLKSAIDCLSPNGRPFINVEFVSPCVGRMQISTAPAIAQVQKDKYV